MPPKTSSIEDLLKKAQSAQSGASSSSPAQTKPVSATSAPKAVASGQQKKLEEKMSEINLQEKEQLVQEKAENLGIPYIALRGFPIAPEALSLIPAKRLKSFILLPSFLQAAKYALEQRMPRTK